MRILLRQRTTAGVAQQRPIHPIFRTRPAIQRGGTTPRARGINLHAHHTTPTLTKTRTLLSPLTAVHLLRPSPKNPCSAAAFRNTKCHPEKGADPNAGVRDIDNEDGVVSMAEG